MICKTSVPPFIHVKSSLDTIVMLRRRRLNRQLRDAVKALSAGVRQHDSKAWGWKRVTIEEPTSEAIQILQEQTPRCELKVQQVDVALDLTCEDVVAANHLRMWLRQHLVQPYSNFKSTIYTSRRRWPGQVMRLYPRPKDKPPKDRTIVRLEMTTRGVERVRKALKVETPLDVVRLDHTVYWTKRLRLHHVDTAAMVRQYIKHNPGLSELQARQAVTLLMRTLPGYGYEKTPPAQAVAIGMRGNKWWDRRFALPRLDAAGLIPTNEPGPSNTPTQS